VRGAIRRQDVLKLVSIGGIAALSAYALHEYVPWVDYDGQAATPRKGLPPNAPAPLKMLGLVRYATLAANGHNAQPWKFALLPDAIEIRPDYSRRLPAVDPSDRELWISLGCALENLIIAARAMGYDPAITYPDANDSIRVALPAATPRWSATFDAIPLRQSTRSEYDGQAVAASQLNQLRTMPLEEGIGIHAVVDRQGMSSLAGCVYEATLSQHTNPPFLAELIRWVRFDKKEALASFDGLFAPCAGSPAVPRWLRRLFVSGAKPETLAAADVRKLQSSAGAIVITSAAERKADWVRAGQVCQRLTLTMTLANIKSAYLNQPIEVPHLRSHLRSSLGLDAAYPQLLVRFGYAAAMPRSLRRPVEQVLMPS
jgi:hypothetical protein